MSKILDRLKAAEERRKRAIAGRSSPDAGPEPLPQPERGNLELEQAHLASLSTAAAQAVERVRAEESAAQLAAARAETEKKALAEERRRANAESQAARAAQVRAAAEAEALEAARAREQEAGRALAAARLRAAAEADAVRLAGERRQSEARTEQLAKERAQRKRQPWMGVTAMIALALLAGSWFVYYSSGKDSSKESGRVTEPDNHNPGFQLKLDRDADAFAVRVKAGAPR